MLTFTGCYKEYINGKASRTVSSGGVWSEQVESALLSVV